MIDPNATARIFENIKTLKARYCRFLDTKDWPALAQLFTTDVIFDRAPTALDDAARLDEGVFRGRDQVMAMIRGAASDVVSVHHAIMPEIDIADETSARAVWAMSNAARAATPGFPVLFETAGHYHETYRVVDRVWRIESIRVTRLYAWLREA